MKLCSVCAICRAPSTRILELYTEAFNLHISITVCSACCTCSAQIMLVLVKGSHRVSFCTQGRFGVSYGQKRLTTKRPLKKRPTDSRTTTEDDTVFVS